MAFWSGLFGKRDSERELDTPPVSLAKLRLQVFSERYFGMQVLDREACAVRPLAPGLVEAIVEDLGGGERTLRWEYLRPFGKTDAELFALAREQAELAVGDTAEQLIDGIQVVASNGFYLSAMLLGRLHDSVHGVLFSPVTWHHWLIHRIQRMTVMPHIQMMRFLAQSIDAQAKVTDAERLIADVYWMRPNRQIERIDFDRDEPVLSRELARVFESL